MIKILLTFHYTGWLIWIHVTVYYNPYITGLHNPLYYNPTNQGELITAHVKGAVSTLPFPGPSFFERIQR